MATERQGALSGSTGSRTRIFYQSGSNWREVPGINSFDLAPSTRTATSYSSFEGTFAGVGTLEVGQATFEVGSYVPGHRAWTFLDNAFNENENVSLRVETNKSEVFDSGTATVAIAQNTGACTFAPTNTVDLMSSVARGHQMVVGTTRYTIEAVSEDDEFYVTPPTSAVTASTFKVEQPILRWLITGKLSSSGGASISEDAATSSQFIIQPTVRVPLPTVQGEHTEGI